MLQVLYTYTSEDLQENFDQVALTSQLKNDECQAPYNHLRAQLQAITLWRGLETLNHISKARDLAKALVGVQRCLVMQRGETELDEFNLNPLAEWHLQVAAFHQSVLHISDYTGADRPAVDGEHQMVLANLKLGSLARQLMEELLHYYIEYNADWREKAHNSAAYRHDTTPTAKWETRQAAKYASIERVFSQSAATATQSDKIAMLDLIFQETLQMLIYYCFGSKDRQMELKSLIPLLLRSLELFDMGQTELLCVILQGNDEQLNQEELVQMVIKAAMAQIKLHGPRVQPITLLHVLCLMDTESGDQIPILQNQQQVLLTVMKHADLIFPEYRAPSLTYAAKLSPNLPPFSLAEGSAGISSRSYPAALVSLLAACSADKVILLCLHFLCCLCCYKMHV